MIRLIVFITFVSISSIYGCTSNNDSPNGDPDNVVTETITYTNTSYDSVEIEIIDIIGTDDPESELYVFGNIRSLVADNNNIYIYDQVFNDLKVMNSDNIINYYYDLSNSEKHGIIGDVLGFDVSKYSDRIYITDMLYHKVYIYNKKMVKINEFNMDALYPIIKATQKYPILIIHNQRERLNEPICHFYLESGEKITSFCERPEGFMDRRNRNVQGIGNTYVAMNANNIYVAFSVPYEIRTYNIFGNLKQKISRNVEFFGDEHERGDFTYPTGMGCGLAVSKKQDLLLYFIRDTKSEKSYLDIYKNYTEYHGTINLSNYDIGEIPVLIRATINNDGLLYITSNKPYPVIIKMAIKIL